MCRYPPQSRHQEQREQIYRLMDIRSYAQLMRLPAIFTVCSNIIAAHLVAVGYWAVSGDIASIQPNTFLSTLLASICLYHGGMVLNDCFDFERDQRERPERPLPAGKISLKTAWLSGWGLLVLGVIFASLSGILTLFIALALALAILAYNAGQRQGWVAASKMGLCRYLNWLMAMSAIGLNTDLAMLAIPVFCYVTALTRISQEEAEAADRRALMQAASVIVMGALFWLAWFATGLFSGLLGALALLIALILLGHRIIRLSSEFTPESIQAVVGALVFGIIPLDAMLLLSSGQTLAALLLLLLLFPGRFLGRFLYVT